MAKIVTALPDVQVAMADAGRLDEAVTALTAATALLCSRMGAARENRRAA